MGADEFIVTAPGAASADGADASHAASSTASTPGAQNDIETRIRDALGGAPDVVFECAGFPGAVMQAMTFIRAKGTIVCMGYGLHPESILTAIPLFKELCVRFSMTYDRADYQEVIDSLAAGQLAPRCMITRTIPLEAMTEALEGLLARAPECKVLVDPWA